MPALKPSYEKVALALANGESQRTAALGAGFSDKPASIHRLCKRPEIQKRVQEIRDGRAEDEARARLVAAQRSGVDLAWCEIRLKTTIELAMRGEPVRDRKGNVLIDPETEKPIYKRDLATAERGLNTMIRYKGGFIDRHEIGGVGDFARLKDDELDRQIVELARKAGIPEEAVLLLEDMTTKEAAE